jgi:glutaredoxin 2
MAVTIQLACTQYSNIQERAQLLTQKQLNQGYFSPRLKSSLQKFYGRHYQLVDTLRNIHISNDNGSLPFSQIIIFPLLQDLTI